MTWQPIETAPKDGIGLIAYAATERNMTFPGRVDVVVAYFDEDGQVCEYGNGKPDIGIVSGYWRATHWMPLPAPPEVGHDR